MSEEERTSKVRILELAREALSGTSPRSKNTVLKEIEKVAKSLKE